MKEMCSCISDYPCTSLTGPAYFDFSLGIDMQFRVPHSICALSNIEEVPGQRLPDHDKSVTA
jgi:hypothetical protein